MFRCLIFASVALAALATLNSQALAEEADPSMIALMPDRDAVIARRLLMNAIGSNNDALHDMNDGVLPMDPFVMEGRLASMAAMLRAFPGLYRAKVDPWTEEGEAADPAAATLATEAVWADFDTFLQMSFEAAQTAQDASLAPAADIKALVDQLEVQCESCHAIYRKEFNFYDFDSLPPVKD